MKTFNYPYAHGTTVYEVSPTGEIINYTVDDYSVAKGTVMLLKGVEKISKPLSFLDDCFDDLLSAETKRNEQMIYDGIKYVIKSFPSWQTQGHYNRTSWSREENFAMAVLDYFSKTITERTGNK